MNKRPLCIVALVYITAICIVLLVDTLGIAHLPLTLRESTAAGLLKDKDTVQVEGKIYKQEIKNDKVVLYLKQSNLFQKSLKVKSNDIIVYTDQTNQFSNGYKIKVSGIARKFQKPSNVGQFNAYLYYKSLNIDFSVLAKEIVIQEKNINVLTSTLQMIRNRLSENFDLITKKDTDNAIFKAMVLGDASEFSGDIKNLYQKGGILHIICISGSHIEVIGIFLFTLLRKGRLNVFLSCLVCIGVVICYGIMTGFLVSAYRAVIMFSVAMFARLLGRSYDILSSLSLAAILILFDNPYYIFNLGFLLSFGAVIGIGGVAPILIRTFEVKSKLLKDLCSTISVTFVTLPILLYSCYEYPIYSTLLNLIVIPISSIVLVSGILGCLFAQLSLGFGGFMLGIGSYILKLYEFLCGLSLELPFATIITGRPSILQIILYYSIFIIMLYGITKWKKKSLSSFVIIMTAVLLIQIPKGFWMTMLDVGQGEGIVIHSKNNVTYMIDGGSSNVTAVGTYRILPFLKANGIKKLDYSILTHPDDDHISGVKELIEAGYVIENIVLPEIGNKDEAYLLLEQFIKDANINIIYLQKGNVIKEGELYLECLHPYKEYETKSQNDYSIVLSMHYKEFSMLFTGDLEAKGEKEIQALLSNDYDVLKVAHHGSKNSTSMELLNQLKAEYALISCGERNRYGHPHQELLQRLEDNHMKVVTTKESGAITITEKNNTIYYSIYGK